MAEFNYNSKYTAPIKQEYMQWLKKNHPGEYYDNFGGKKPFSKLSKFAKISKVGGYVGLASMMYEFAKEVLDVTGDIPDDMMEREQIRRQMLMDNVPQIVIDEKGNSIDKSKWLFSAIELIFKDFKEKHGFKIKNFNLFGHSAGGGFVHRYLLFNPNAPVNKSVSANPAFVTLPDPKIEYPFGLKKTPLKKLNIKSWFNQNMAIVLGSNDLGPRTKPLSNGPMAKAQGPNCLTRGKLLFEEATTMAKRKKYQLNWELIIANGVGHDNYNIAPIACNYLFDLKKMFLFYLLQTKYSYQCLHHKLEH